MDNNNILGIEFAPELEQAAQEKYKQDLEVLKCVGMLSDAQIEDCARKAIERNNPVECVRFFVQEMMNRNEKKAVELWNMYLAKQKEENGSNA